MQKFYTVGAVLLWVYVVGEICQTLLIGPGWLRGYMSDLGTVGAWTSVCLHFGGPRIQSKGLWVPTIGWMVACLTEGLQLVGWRAGYADVVDVICYSIGFGLIAIAYGLDHRGKCGDHGGGT